MYNRNMLASILFFVTGYLSMAQGSNPPPPTPPPPPGLPIDNGVVLLFLLALIYGIYKTFKASIQKPV